MAGRCSGRVPRSDHTVAVTLPNTCIAPTATTEAAGTAMTIITCSCLIAAQVHVRGGSTGLPSCHLVSRAVISWIRGHRGVL
jgi:hypothetical protein